MIPLVGCVVGNHETFWQIHFDSRPLTGLSSLMMTQISGEISGVLMCKIHQPEQKCPYLLCTPQQNVTKKALTYVDYPSNLYASGVLFFQEVSKRAKLEAPNHLWQFLSIKSIHIQPSQERRAIEKPGFLCCGTDLHDASWSSQCW